MNQVRFSGGVEKNKTSTSVGPRESRALSHVTYFFEF